MKNMKNTYSLLLAILFVAALACSAMAMSHESDMKHGSGMDHGSGMEQGHDAHQSMQMQGHAEMAMLGAKVEDGVEAAAHLNDVKAAMAKAGMKETHHFMVLFTDVGTGSSIETGTVALKIKGPDGQETGPISLIGMEGHFGADIVLTGKGNYEFMVGTKLPDGKTRQFSFDHQLK